MKKAQRTYRDPIKYTIGDGPEDSLTTAQYDELHDKLTEWFKEWRVDSKAPAADVRHRIKCCLEGTTLDGQKWWSHWNSSLATRLRMMCRFDMEKMQPIRSASERYKETARRKAEKRLKKEDPMVPDELRKAVRAGGIKYGDAASALLSQKEHERWAELKALYLKQFPELNNIASATELDLLCDLQIQQERQRLKLLQPKPDVHEGQIVDLSRAVVDLKKALGIHPDQLAKRVDKDDGGSISSVVAALGTVDRARDLRARFFLEEMLTLYKMYHTQSPNPNSGGYQLDDVRLFAHTKCRTCACSSCGTRNFVGVDINEIEALLIEEGVLTPQEPEPQAVETA